MEQLHCESCGHENPPGTQLCQACGKPFHEDDGPLNMRYEGVALRSQTYQRTFVDQVWNFFASVKVGIWFMFITLVASAIGTIYPQQMYIPSNADPVFYYPDQYGTLGSVYVSLGLHNMYSSWWYVTLLVLIGISLIITSIDRGIPLHKSLKQQRVRRHTAFMKRQRIHGQSGLEEDRDFATIVEKSKSFLTKKGYKVRQDGQALLAEKGRLSRYGPYVVHVGLILLLIGSLMRILPGFTMDDYVWVRDGQTVPIHSTNGQYHIASEGFVLELYDRPGLEELIPEQFITEAVLYEQMMNDQTGESELKQVKRQTIKVNQPMVHDNLRIYQSDYILNEFSQFSFEIEHKETEQIIGEVDVDLYNPQRDYELQGDYHVRLIEYYPHFELDQNNQPATRSNIPNNPAFIFELRTPQNPEGERSWIFVGQRIENPDAQNEYELKISDITFTNVTGLLVSKELSLPVIYSGLAITMLGLMLCFYWQHRRMWLQKEQKVLWLAAHTNKNWFGLRNEVEALIDHTQLAIDKQTLDKEEDV